MGSFLVLIPNVGQVVPVGDFTYVGNYGVELISVLLFVVFLATLLVQFSQIDILFMHPMNHVVI